MTAKLRLNLFNHVISFIITRVLLIKGEFADEIQRAEGYEGYPAFGYLQMADSRKDFCFRMPFLRL